MGTAGVRIGIAKNERGCNVWKREPVDWFWQGVGERCDVGVLRKRRKTKRIDDKLQCCIIIVAKGCKVQRVDAWIVSVLVDPSDAVAIGKFFPWCEAFAIRVKQRKRAADAGKCKYRYGVDVLHGISVG